MSAWNFQPERFDSGRSAAAANNDARNLSCAIFDEMVEDRTQAEIIRAGAAAFARTDEAGQARALDDLVRLAAAGGHNSDATAMYRFLRRYEANGARDLTYTLTEDGTGFVVQWYNRANGSTIRRRVPG